MKKPITTAQEAEEVAQYLKQELGDYHKCCGLSMPKPGALIQVTEPLESCYLHDPRWGTKNLVDGCIPAGTYKVRASGNPGQSSHYIDLIPVNGGPTITACVGYADRSMVDWRGILHLTVSLWYDVV